ncbi:MAG: hypothetical protein LAO77_04365 [Acidobacteriia bacterium]|nr:hypothetical protein [Terriglobia bacterium]
MPTSDLPSLLDDAGFLAELERFERLPKCDIEEKPITDAQLEAIEDVSRRPADAADPGFDEAAQRRAHAALERALEPEYHEQQHRHSYTPRSGRVPTVVVLLVTVLGLAAGAGAAGVMFRDRVAQLVVHRIHTK